MRKIYMYKSDDARGQVDTFIKTSNLKIKKKFNFILRYIADEKNQFKEPYRNILGKEVVKNTNSICEQILKDYNYRSEGHNELSNEESQERKYFKMQNVDMFTITGSGTVITGKVESGKINVNEQIYVNNKMYTVVGIESNSQIINSASEGMNIGILIKGKTTKEFEKGSIVTNRIDSISSETHINNSSLENTTDKQSRGCYVATCVYGSYDCPQVWTLRRFRDNTLAETMLGRAFIRTYYAISPTIVKWFGNTSWFKKMWKGTLDRMLSKLQANGVEDTPYQDRNWQRKNRQGETI